MPVKSVRSIEHAMTVRYKITFRDLLAFCFYHYLRSPILVATYGIGLVFISFVVFQMLPKDGSAIANTITFLVIDFIALALLAGIAATSIVLSMISRRNKTFLTDCTMTLGENGFISETPYARSEQKWAIVQKLARNNNYIFLYVAQYMAHVIPRRAFRDDAEWNSFYEFCRQRTQAATSGHNPCWQFASRAS